MVKKITISMAQLNPVVGDISGNTNKLLSEYDQISEYSDLLIVSELYISGYPPEDLVMRKPFQDSVRQEILRICNATKSRKSWIAVGAPWIVNKELYNAVLVIGEGKIQDVCLKHILPNYSVFDEVRVFSNGPLPVPVTIKGIDFGILICEDAWSPETVSNLSNLGIDILIVINGSPFDEDKIVERQKQMSLRINKTETSLIYVNQVGGQDELVFDGSSFVMDSYGKIIVQFPSWIKSVQSIELNNLLGKLTPASSGLSSVIPEKLEMIYRALIYGLRDYTEKNGFNGVVMGISGGIDSALTAAIAVDALGAENTHCIMLPSIYTSDESIKDANDCLKRLGLKSENLSIQETVDTLSGLLSEIFLGKDHDTTEENIQARVRSVILMALSNKFGYMLLTTGNKSEISVGFATLYGDMSGGYSVLKDVYKTRVYELAKWRNHNIPEDSYSNKLNIIPNNILSKMPTAELRPNQTDQDTLPPYDELDKILYGLIDNDMSVEDLIAKGHSASLVSKIENLIYCSEYKRRQSSPGVRISKRNFGGDRRFPVTNFYRESNKGK